MMVLFFFFAVTLFFIAICLLFVNYLTLLEEWKHLSPEEKGMGIASGVAAIFPRCRNPQTQKRAIKRAKLAFLLILIAFICFCLSYFGFGGVNKQGI